MRLLSANWRSTHQASAVVYDRIAIADAIAGFRPFSEEEAAVISRELDALERAEFIAIAAQYLGIAAQCRALQIPAEPGAPARPSTKSTDDR